MSQKDDDDSLIARAVSGEREAFRELLNRHYDRVFRVAFSILGNRTDAEDVTQDVWVNLPGKLRQWRGDAKFTSWIHRIAINASKDFLRRADAHTRKVAGYAEVEGLTRAAQRDTQLKLSWLEQALGTLSDDLRETAALTLGEDMNFADAAEVLGIAEGTVAWRMSEIRRRLKSLASNDNGLGKEALA